MEDASSYLIRTEPVGCAFVHLPGWAVVARRTMLFITSLETGKCIVIPYCTVNEQGNNKLGLWRIESLNELVAGMWNIMEPPKDRWGEPGKEVPPGEIDLALVPGVAFDVNGGRLGNGKGYYDRLLHEVRHDCELIGAGFQAQVFEQVPMDDHDVYLDGVLTETGFYRGKGRGPGNHG